MKFPIILYNDLILKKKSLNLNKKHNISSLINNMFDTMYSNKGIGLSAPQIGLNINLFIIVS